MLIARRAALLTLALPALGRAQPGWAPTRPIQLVAGFAPGGGSDVIARTIAEAAAPLYPVPLVVVNRPGAGGALAAEQVSRAAPDGHTMLLAGGSESTSVPAHRDVPYDPKTGFTPIIRLTRHGQFIVTKARGGRFTDMRQVIEAAKARPDAVSHASAGVGTLSHSIFLLLGRAAGVEMLHVPFTGGGPSLQAVVAGQVDVSVAAPEEMRGLVDGGELRVLAVASPERLPAYPDAPTLRELGWNVVAENMKGWVGPPGLTPEITAFHHDRMKQAIATPIWQRFLERAGEADGYADGPAFQAAMDNLLDSIRAALRRA
ncbi:tripartite tricarboxylate transporter substrate binding protein [Sabulicella glaciei]|uniref:Tripartite tricarboxylate transporter substrate binding protein n=1 Tax=Sabulicella glaciei TaxID=2984948 RepID=A0ABT3NX87_9PROT|nr:tripartite tricarboxylate transporter substrate binding protein [Roseococcus sp. MDT2-1-1]MCW8086764.1 tripartite tricarboxylate transporter substrate binding protein [Roseococcus sp. MDT2-1-1]